MGPVLQQLHTPAFILLSVRGIACVQKGPPTSDFLNSVELPQRVEAGREMQLVYWFPLAPFGGLALPLSKVKDD